MTAAISFIVGMSFGGIIGIMLISLCRAATRRDGDGSV